MSEPDRRSVPNLLDLPLTSEIARSRPGSRDFAFAGGNAPPPLVVSPPPEYSTSGLHTIPETMAQSMATAAEILGMDAAGISYSDTGHSRGLGGGDSVAARSVYETTVYTAQQDQRVIPNVEITQASNSVSSSDHPTMYTMANEPTDSRLSAYHSAAASQSQYSTAQATAYETAGSPNTRPGSALRDSVSSYQSAPPPVPSKYATASEYSESSQPIRYQLRDPQDQWGTASQGRSTMNQTEYYTPRPPTSRMTTAEQGTMSMAYRSAISSTSPRSTGYETAPPPPISRSNSEKQSFMSFDQEKAETGTHISEPDSDVGLLADLERRSSWGSLAPDRVRKKSVRSKSYYTAPQWTGSERTPLGTAEENTLYLTARESAYTTAATSLAEVTTARGTQE